jgi:hypothetical protein
MILTAGVTMRHFPMLAAALAVGLLAGCGQVPEANPYPPVPALLQDTPTKPPVTEEALMWQPGHWDWNGSGYIWAKGQYVPAAGHGNLWVPGWWSRTDTGWVWQPAHWTS